MTTTKIEIELQRISRRMDAFQAAQDLAVGDRNILEDILLRLESVERALHMSREKAGEVQKDIKSDIHTLQGAVEDRVQEVQKTLNNKEILIVKKDIFAKIKKFLRAARDAANRVTPD